MKKMMMFLMVSVFFLMGGMTDGMAQKTESRTGGQVILTPLATVKQIGETALMQYFINGISQRDFYSIYVFVQKPGKSPELLAALDTDGTVRYLNPVMRGRMTVTYYSSSMSGSIRIANLRAEDSGDYYVALVNSFGMMYFSNGANLFVTFMPVTAPRKDVSSKQK